MFGYFVVKEIRENVAPLAPGTGGSPVSVLAFRTLAYQPSCIS